MATAGLLAGSRGTGTASPPPRPRRPGTGWRGGRCRSRGARSSSTGLRGPGAGAARPLGRAPHRGRRARRPLLRPGLLPRPGPALADGLLPPRRSRAGSPRWPGEEGLPVDRLMRTLGIRRVAEREAAALDPELRALLERFCAGVNAAAASATALPFEMQLLRLRVRALAPGRHPQPRQAARLRPLDQLGAGAAARRHGARAGPGAGGPARPRPTRPTTRSSPRKPWSGDGLALVEQIDAVRRSIGLAAEASGSNNWAVSGAAQRHRLAADRRRPAPAPEHAGHLVPGRACATASASSAAPRCRGCPASTWARTTTSAGPSPTSWPTSRTSSSSGSRATATCSKTSGGRCETVREEIVVKGRDEPERARGAHHPPRPDRQRGARRRRGRAAGAALADARRTDRLRRHVRAARDRLRPGAGREARGPHLARLEPDLGRPPRLDRLQADRPPAAAPRRLPRPAEAGLDAASSSGRGRSPTTSCRRWSTPRAASWSPPTTASSATSTRTTSPASGSTASAPSGSSSCCGRARSTTSRASRRCRPTTSRCPGSRRRGGSAG